MRQIEAIGDQEKEIFNAPDTSGGSDLGQSPAHPRLDCISKQQCDTRNGCQDLYIDDQRLQLQEINLAYPAGIERGRASKKLSVA